MEVDFTPEQEAQLARIASNAGTNAEQLVKETALRLFEVAASSRSTARANVVAEMRALRARLGPDPEGWTTRDYIQYGRR